MHIPPIQIVCVLLFLSISAFLAFRFKKLTATGSFTGFITGILIFLGSGFTGIAMLVVFFLAGTIATKWRSEEKNRLGIAEQNHGIRQASQVIANSGVAALIGIAGFVFPHAGLHFEVLIACCFSSAIADTLSSELGMVYGKRFFNIISFRRDERGRDGVVSFEGTVAGIAGSVILAVIFLFFQSSLDEFLIIIIAGFIGNLSDSIIGATMERRGMIKNDGVNFLNTLVAAFAGFLMIQ